MQKSSVKLTKENQELRRQLEILKAQAKVDVKGSIKTVTTQNKRPQENQDTKQIIQDVAISTQYVKKDLLRTAILSTIVFSVIFGIYFSGKFS